MLIERLRAGDLGAFNQLVGLHRERLKRMLQLRIDRRLQARVDVSDVLQEALVDIWKNIDDYLADPRAPFYLWLRKLAGLKLVELHRRHLGAQRRDAGREQSLNPFPEINTTSLADELIDNFSSPSQAALRNERRVKLHEAICTLEPLDREVLALRHFEQLDNMETADVLGLTPSGATARHVRALKRLKKRLEDIPGFFAEGHP